jgi:hypothetical protein
MGTTRQESPEKSPSNARQNGSRSNGPLVAATIVVVLLVSTVAWRQIWMQDKPGNGASHVETAPQPSNNVIFPATMPIGIEPTWDQIDNPAQDGWETEVLARETKKQLKILGTLIVDSQQREPANVTPVVDRDFSCESLLPIDLQTVFDDTYVKTQRMQPQTELPTEAATGSFVGTDGLLRVLRSLGEDFQDAKDARFKFKLFRIQVSGETAITRQYLAVSGRTPTGTVEHHATWVMRWKVESNSGRPKLQWIGVEQFERTISTYPAGQLFSDCTESALRNNTSFRQQFLFGMNHWLSRTKDVSFAGNPGLALGDVNGDGLDDLYVCQESGLPNRLFLQNPDGTASDVSAKWGVDWLESSRSALLIDLDNDGNQDLVVAMDGNLIVAASDGQRFVIRAVLPTDGYAMSLCSADYDNDGDLDLYICILYSNEDLQGRLPIASAGVSTNVFHDAQNGGHNSLFRNDISTDEWSFTDVTDQVGLDVDNQRVSYAASWEDYDNDGDQDLYVANDYGGNSLFQNNTSNTLRLNFVDLAKVSGVEDRAAGMSVSWGDYNRDGNIDLYVGNMFSAAGGRIAFQNRFKTDSAEVKSQLQRFARGSTLLKNSADGNFADVSLTASVNVGRWAWSSVFGDVNNDGWEDLIVANGFITTDDTSDL